MKILSKLQREQAKIRLLSWSEKLLLVYVLGVLIVFRALLVLFPLKWFIMPQTGSGSHTSKKGMPQAIIDKRVWAVRALSARLPLGFTCLVQALAMKWLLKNQPDVRVHIGVHKNSVDSFSAHAWVTCQYKTILGEQPNLVFEPILAWN